MRHLTEEHKRKIGAANAIALRGKHPSKETRLKMGLAHRGNTYRRGTHQTEEWKKAMSARMKGRTFTDETRKKLSDAHKNLHKDISGAKNPFYGRRHSPESIAKISGPNNHTWKGGVTAAQSSRKYRKKYPERVRVINQNRRARERGAEGSHTEAEWLRVKVINAYLCAGCGDIAFNIKLTEDHIIPLSRGGTNYISNIQPLCPYCNCRKWATLPDEISID
jgi:hypothetical protein